MSARARSVEPNDHARAAGALANPDYAAAWEVLATNGDTRSPEQWARATFEQAPTALRSFVVAGWVAALGLRLGPRPSPDHILGWPIVSAASDTLVMGVHSVLLGAAQIVVQVDGSRILLTSLVRYEKLLARPLWSLAQPIHHLVVPYLLGSAASRPPVPSA